VRKCEGQARMRGESSVGGWREAEVSIGVENLITLLRVSALLDRRRDFIRQFEK
jgi:hypothetical protein